MSYYEKAQMHCIESKFLFSAYKYAEASEPLGIGLLVPSLDFDNTVTVDLRGATLEKSSGFKLTQYPPTRLQGSHCCIASIEKEVGFDHMFALVRGFLWYLSFISPPPQRLKP